MVDFQRLIRNATGVVRRIEYDPNRTTRIALVDYFEDGTPEGPDRKIARTAYVLATDGMRSGDAVRAGDSNVDIRPGNAMPLGSMPAGTLIHNIELLPGQGGRLVRAAGATATLVKKGEDGYATVKLPSGEQRLILLKCYATVGVLSNREHQNRVLGKAGAKRWLGIRPTVRGVAMNPIDHPMGGGEGRTSGGRPSCSPWGVQTKGKRTRNNKRTDAFRVARRPPGKHGNKSKK
jgi:large subunit ribosomal protein L2